MKIQDQATIAPSEEGACKKVQARSGQKSPGAKEPGRARGEKEARGGKWAGNKIRRREISTVRTLSSKRAA